MHRAVWDALEGLPVAGFGTAKFTLLKVKVADLTMNQIMLFRWTKSKSATK